MNTNRLLVVPGCGASIAIAVAALLAGCATTRPAPDTTPGSPAAPVAAQWHAPLPHGGRVADLVGWWERVDDPLLPRLIHTAQGVNGTLAQAGARLADARAAHTAGVAALLPTLDATASADRGRASPGAQLGSSRAIGLQAGWEIDLFGANRAGANAAQARLDASAAEWHDARVSVAAEVANAYVDLRACEAQRAQSELDASSRAETARLTALAARSGFQPPAAADLARASAAQGRATLTQQRARCDLSVKALVALTAIDEPTLRRDLAAGTARLPQPALLAVAEVPAQVLAQRPDIAAAARGVIAASADADQAEAQRWPRVTLAGSLSSTRLSGGGVSTDGTTWSVGPIAVTLPLFDAGVRRANAQAARARYEAASVVYAARLRDAVREVEAALVTLHSAAARDDDARDAVDGFERSYRATEARHRGGLASLFELEDARRSLVAARGALVEQQRERVAAWIATYRAIGGGWSPADAIAGQGALQVGMPGRNTPPGHAALPSTAAPARH